jgi:Fic family protein
MQIPLHPPKQSALFKDLKPETLKAILKEGSAPLVKGQYLHWDELRHRQPPAELTAEYWWMSIKLARQALYRYLPSLRDKTGRSFVFGMPEPVLIDLHHIDRDAAGEISDAADVTTPEHRDRYLRHSLIEEAITSSQLEGASTTRRVAEAMLREGRKPRDQSERMIFNNYRAMEMIREIKTKPITPARILELHRSLTEGTLENPKDAGKLRETDDVRVEDHRDGTVLHQPPPAAELQARLERLCQFANEDEKGEPFVHPVIRGILVHFMIGYDHPFVDGNGRTARALFYWSMARQGYWLMEFLSISHILRKAPAQYVRAYLHTETDDNDTTYFIIHQLDVIRKSISALHDYLDQTVKEQRATGRLLASSPKVRDKLNHRQVALLTHALKHPGERYRVEGHQRSHVVVYETARSDLLNLAKLGLLEKTHAGRAFVFTAPDNLRERIDKLA